MNAIELISQLLNEEEIEHKFLYPSDINKALIIIPRGDFLNFTLWVWDGTHVNGNQLYEDIDLNDPEALPKLITIIKNWITNTSENLYYNYIMGDNDK